MSAKVLIPEIQGLRAIAVLVVVLFHIWPEFLPGGYTGVDIFFVISGFLITNILVRDLTAKGRIDYVRFYSRRIARLAPAAGVVIFFVLIFHQLFSPLYHNQIFEETTSSTLFFQNWKLAFEAIDYLDADNAASPLQHFWSLSVEEQYYLFWPFTLFVLSIAVFRKGVKLSRRVIRNFLITITVASLAFSVYQSYTNAPFAYFNFFTRVWELGLGSILATTTFWRRLGPRVYRLLGLSGLAMIVLSIIYITESSVFPGYIALLPTCGAALVIVYSVAKEKSLILRWILNNRLSQFFGDISYSLYLWHWPLIILLMSLSDDVYLMGFVVLLASVVFAGFSKVYVEDTFRSFSGLRGVFCIVLVFMLVPIILSTQKDFLVNLTSGGSDEVSNIEIGLSVVKADKPETYAKKCYAHMTSTEVVTCEYGDKESDKTIVALGDSHMMNWLPATFTFGEHHSYKVIPVNKSSCFIGRSESMNFEENKSCHEWNEGVNVFLKDLQPDIILVGQSIGHTFKKEGNESVDTLVEALGNFANEFDQSKIVLIKDIPWMAIDVPECLAKNTSAYEKCHQAKDSVVDVVDRPDPITRAAKEYNLRMIDMTSDLCDDKYCLAYDSDGIRWRDGNHLSASYVERLAPSFSQKFLNLIKVQ